MLALYYATEFWWFLLGATLIQAALHRVGPWAVGLNRWYTCVPAAFGFVGACVAGVCAVAFGGHDVWTTVKPLWRKGWPEETCRELLGALQTVAFALVVILGAVGYCVEVFVVDARTDAPTRTYLRSWRVTGALVLRAVSVAEAERTDSREVLVIPDAHRAAWCALRDVTHLPDLATHTRVCRR